MPARGLENDLPMQAIAEIQIVPIGVGVSMRKEVMRAYELLRMAGLRVHLHATGTDVEGSLDQILDAVRALHETLHREGVPRLTTTVQLGTRLDKEPSLRTDEAEADTGIGAATAEAMPNMPGSRA